MLVDIVCRLRQRTVQGATNSMCGSKVRIHVHTRFVNGTKKEYHIFMSLHWLTCHSVKWKMSLMFWRYTHIIPSLCCYVSPHHYCNIAPTLMELSCMSYKRIAGSTRRGGPKKLSLEQALSDSWQSNSLRGSKIFHNVPLELPPPPSAPYSVVSEHSYFLDQSE